MEDVVVTLSPEDQRLFIEMQDAYMARQMDKCLNGEYTPDEFMKTSDNAIKLLVKILKGSK